MSVMVKQNEKQKLTLLEKLQKCTLSWEIYKTFIRQIFHPTSIKYIKDISCILTCIVICNYKKTVWQIQGKDSL